MTKKSNSKMMGSAKIVAIIPQMSTSPKGLRKSSTPRKTGRTLSLGIRRAGSPSSECRSAESRKSEGC